MINMNELIDYIIRKLSQQTPNALPPMDPNAIQQGQTVYDESGTPFTVAENDPMKPEMVLLEEGQEPLNGIQTVENQEISNRYTVQDPIDPSNPDPNAVTACIHQAFNRKNSSLALNSCDKINPIDSFEISKQNYRVTADLDSSFNTPSLDLGVDFPEFNPDPQSGYTEIKNFVQNLISKGVSDTDIIIAVGEEFEKTFAERVLRDLKDRGIF